VEEAAEEAEPPPPLPLSFARVPYPGYSLRASHQVHLRTASMMIIIVYWYLFSNHYTLECIHTGEKKSGRNFSVESPGLLLAPSSWCLHASHANHLASSPYLVSSQAGLGTRRYLLLHARWTQFAY